MRLSRLLLPAGFIAAFAIRVAYLRHFSTNFDVANFAGTVEILRRGGDLYRDTDRYNYSPLWAWLLVGIDAAARPLHVSFGAAVGAWLLAVDAATALVLRRLAGGGLRGATAALLFFANPVSIFVSSFHLQFDDFAILFLLVALACDLRTRASRVGAAIALGASLVVKHVTIFFPPLFVRGRRERPGLTVLEGAVPYALFAAAFLPYAGSWGGIRRHVLGYRGLSEDYGTAMLLKIPGAPAWLPTAVFLVGVGAAILWLRRSALDPARACLLLSLVTLLLVPGICEYYFVWPIALGALFGGAGYAVYTLVVSAFFLGSPDGLNLPIAHLPGWHGVWWSIVLWITWELRDWRSILSST